MSDTVICDCCGSTEGDATEECQFCSQMKCTKCDEGTSFHCVSCEKELSVVQSALSAAQTRIAELTKERDEAKRAFQKVRSICTLRMQCACDRPMQKRTGEPCLRCELLACFNTPSPKEGA